MATNARSLTDRSTALTASYFTWALAVLAIVFAKGGGSPDNLTRVATIGWFAATFLALPTLRRLACRRPPWLVFVLASAASAAVVEFCYMFTEPLDKSLRIGLSTSFGDAVRFTAIDLALTFPAYFVIFSVIWALIRRYDYRPIEFAVLMSAGQAIGDGIAYFSANPPMLTFLPWQMINYQAMALVPFLAVLPRLRAEPGARSPAMFVLPLIVIPVTYWFAAAAILTFGRFVGWIG